MCGICGMAGFSERDLLVRMCATLRHRGPDRWGMFCDEGVGLGSTRLAVIDSVTGRQPMHNEERTIWIVFDGEIYNSPELRRQLLSKGHTFRTASDTETILHLYEEKGEGCLQWIEGMFAFALWDGRQRVLMLARDRIGIKPLHYAILGNRLLFGSEIKALLEYESLGVEVDPRALHDYLSYLCVPAPRTMMKNIRKLRPGHLLTYRGGVVATRCYWEVQPHNPDGRTPTQHREAIRHLMEDAVRRELRSDSPVGVLLSGGADSSTVTALAATYSAERLRTFTVGFAEEEDQHCDERAYARHIAGMYGTEHHELLVSPNIVSYLPRMVRFFDEPFGNPTAIAAYLISEMAKRYVSVVLNGIGGDELFGGYPRYIGWRFIAWYAELPRRLRRHTVSRILDVMEHDPHFNRLIYRFREFDRVADMSRERRYFGLISLFTEDEKRELYSPDLCAALGGEDSASVLDPYLRQDDGSDPVNQLAYTDVRAYLTDNLLTYFDRMSMAVSLETRVPLCDHRLVEYALGIPSWVKMRHLRPKYLMREAVRDLLPRDTLSRRKQGFVLPVERWLRRELRVYVQEVLLDPSTLRRPYFRGDRIERLLFECLDGKRGSGVRVWALLILELWNRLYLDGEGRLSQKEKREARARAHRQPVLPAGSRTFGD